MTRKSKRELERKIEEIEPDPPADTDDEADPETLGWLFAYFGLSPEAVREAAPEYGLSPGELLEEYHRYREGGSYDPS